MGILKPLSSSTVAVEGKHVSVLDALVEPDVWLMDGDDWGENVPVICVLLDGIVGEEIGSCGKTWDEVAAITKQKKGKGKVRR